MFLERVDEIHLTKVRTKNSGDVKFPEWDHSEWTEEVIEKLQSDSKNDYNTTYSVWTRR